MALGYVQVDDPARAHQQAPAYMHTHESVYAFNLGNGQGCSVREVIDGASKVAGRLVPYETAPRRCRRPPLSAPTPGWAGRRVTPPDEIVETANRWHCSPRH